MPLGARDIAVIVLVLAMVGAQLACDQMDYTPRQLWLSLSKCEDRFVR